MSSFTSEKLERCSETLVKPMTVSMGVRRTEALSGLTWERNSPPLTKWARILWICAAIFGSGRIFSVPIRWGVHCQPVMARSLIVRCISPSMVPSWPSSTSKVPVFACNTCQVSSCMSEESTISTPGMASTSSRLAANPRSDSNTTRSTSNVSRKSGTAARSSSSPGVR